MDIYKVIKPILKSKYIRILVFSVINIIVAFIAMIIPIVSGTFIDTLVNTPSITIIQDFCILLILVTVASLLFSYLLSIMSIKIKLELSYILNEKVLSDIQRARLFKINELNMTYINQRVNTDSNQLIAFIIDLISNFITNLFTIIFTYIYIAKINIYIASIIIVLDIVYIFIFIKFKNKMRYIKNKLKDESAMYYTNLFNQINNVRLVRLFDYGVKYKSYLHDSFKRLYKTLITNQNLVFLFQSSESIVYMFAQLSLFAIGGIEIIRGNMSIGTFSVISGYFVKLVGSTKYFANLGNESVEVKIAANRLLEYIEIDKEQCGDMVVEEIKKLSLIDLSFSYNSFMRVLDNLSITFVVGKSYVITGDNGIGKSTLLDIIAGFYNTEYIGNFFIDDINFKEIDLTFYRKNCLSYHTQKSDLLLGTIEENMSLDESIDMEFYKKLISGFNLGNLIDKKNSRIKIENSDISGGELQKISLIRTFQKKSKIILLDEPSTHLDKESVHFLLHLIDILKKDKIVIINSHDKEIIKNCDICIKLEN